jgi:tetratricopeptide (TPR) repeat protein
MKLEAGGSGNLTGTTSITAYEHYLRGMQLWHLRSVASLEQSIEAFQAAIAIDPGFAKAHAGLALAWSVIDGYSDRYLDVAQQNTLAAARQALSLDPENVEAKAAMGTIYRDTGRHGEAQQLYREAIESSPSFATAHQWYGGLLAEMGDPDAGLEAYRKAWSLDPRSRIIGYNLAWRLWGLGLDAEAWQVINEVRSFAPDFAVIQSLVLVLNVVEGQCADAIETARQLASLLGKPEGSAQLYADLCQDEDAARRQRAVETILAWDRPRFDDPGHPSLSYSWDLLVIFIAQSDFDAYWRLFEKELNPVFALGIIRTIRTENNIRLLCSERFQAALAEHGLPPAVDPPTCQ